MIYVSFVIPTRNRPEYLRFALESAINQDCNLFEIIVADNSTDNESELVVKSLQSNRIHYFRSGGNLSMSENWEFAVSKANGLFISIIGDDDAVLPFFVSRIIALNLRYKPEIIFWNEHIYIWPNKENASRIEYLSPKKKDMPYRVKGKIQKVLQTGGLGLRSIPMIYHSAVARTLLDKIIDNSGKLFPVAQPDVYNGFTMSANNPKIIKSGEALSISGWSPSSNSGAMRENYGSSILKEYVEKSSFSPHRTLLDLIEMRFFNTTPDAILNAMDCYPYYFKGMFFNYSAMWALFNRLNNYNFTFWILRNSTKISNVHKFNISVFLLFLFLNLIKTLYQVISKFFNSKAKHSFKDISKFIDYLVHVD